ncbi:filamentous haemagglutinin family protein [Sphingomonas sp. dw_22]|uniref:filamentous haemagglutinin family protein n=1 Tax=Sphingomonas sp. dw_22 TaxID=2721175 RepID=UPI001BD45BE1|nr:filamentous haemagglutinin family protein [Sphingomonas sp. dw_22]
MIPRALSPLKLPRRGLQFGASLAALAIGLVATPSAAQTLGATLGAQASRPRPPVQQPATTPRRSGTMQAALARQQSTQSRIAQIRAYATQLRQAVNRSGATDGLSENGLDPTQAINDALAALKAGDTDRATQLLVSAGAANDPTGLATWEGAGLPNQSTGADGKVTVTIDQTQERALLSWNKFNIGANTTLQFNQKSNGTAQPGWVAVNRVTNATDPSLILGNLKADGTVVVLNRAGIIFGSGSQVNTHSLLASTLELGNAATLGQAGQGLVASTIKNRNDYYLENGLFAPANGTAGVTSDSRGAALLVSGLTEQNGANVRFTQDPEGAVIVDSGARLSSDTGGFLILAAPTIDSAGTLSAVEGQVSLQAGRAVSFIQSTGSDTDADPYVRGYKLNSFDYGLSDSNQLPRDPTPGDGTIFVDGLIESKRGYLSLGTNAWGSIEVNGLLSTTTSVSRNGKISITGGNILLAGSSDPARASGIEMIADDNGETIPQGSANEPATFKASQLEIGTQVQILGTPVGALVPTDLTMGQNALIYAPGANVSIGATTVPEAIAGNFLALAPGHIDIGSGATIDVSGYKDVQLDASRNAIAITPVKRNELRDTPNYREVALDGNFTLNGATLYVDPRLSGVRADGVAWVGSPLIEAGSLASQIPVTAQEFMTKGGTVSLLTSTPVVFNNFTLANSPSIHIARDATIDFSGGWVNYAAGTVKTSKLITNDGRIVDISKADPNDVYVGVVNGYTDVQPRFGVLTTYLNSTSQGARSDASYDEGRDAGALTINAPAVAIDGTFYGNAFAGSRQVLDGKRPSLASTILGDGRLLQRTQYELPSGGGVTIKSLGDVLVYHGVRGAAESNWSELLLNDGMLSDAGLSSLSLTATGSVTFAGSNPFTLQSSDALQITGASSLTLAPGGALSVDAGRTIRFEGIVTAASGSIDAKTDLFGSGLGVVGIPNGSAFRVGLYGDGNGDDVSFLYGSDPGELRPFDVVVTGTLSTAGLWVNDFTEGALLQGGAFRNGGSISLASAPNFFAAIGTSLNTATEAVDLSGSIRVDGTLNVMAGGYVSSTGSLTLDAKGGDVSLINRTTYASTSLTDSGRLTSGTTGTSDIPLGGSSQSVEFTPLPSGAPFGKAVLPNLVPDPRSTVDISNASILGFGFAGGGTFALVAPDVSFGSDDHAGSTHIGLDFFKNSGFGTLDVSTSRSRIVDDLFANGSARKSAFLETTRFTIGAGETLDLTQWLLPSILTADQSRALRSLGSGANLLDQAFLSPTKMDAAWDQKAAKLVLGGLTELDVLAGGSIIGAPQASLTVSKLYNAGSIVLHGGTIEQRNDLPDSLVVGGLGVRDADLGGSGLADAFGGATDGQGRFDENALNSAGVTDPTTSGRILTNRELVSRDGADRLVYFLGRLDSSEGILLDNGSVTDLSGTAVLNPRAPILTNGSQIRTGYVLDGGSIRLRSGQIASRQTGSGQSVTVLDASTLVRLDGASLDIGGTSTYLDRSTGLGAYAPYLEWSAAGTISALGGGSLGTTHINARGGNVQAEGGTLEWLRPTIGSDEDGGLDYLNAGMIADSGFDSFVARNTLTLDGDFSLFLRKALMVVSQDPTQSNTPLGADANVYVSATTGTNATLGANYVRFASRLGTVQLPTSGANGDASVRFAAGAQGVDLVGGIGFDRSIASVGFLSPGDVRLTGVNDRPIGQVAYNGQLVANGDLLIDARRTYATTGTGNLQALLEGSAATLTVPYVIAATGDHSITFGNSYLDANAPAPLSAGTHVRVLAARIQQNGYLAAPLGLLELGSTTTSLFSGASTMPTQSVTFGSGSVTTVSGAGLNIPYGTTTDLIEYYYPTILTPITKLPTGQLNLAANSIVEESGALIDGRGGGDTFAYEFQSGVGGSRDVLDRINRDPFSANDFNPLTGSGYQFADHRQVFALVPVSQANRIAPYDPVYSADYGSAGPADLYGAQAGLTVTLDAAPGVPGGEYLLVPAKYAMAIPGALRLVENAGTSAPVPGQSTTLLDGTVVVGGTFGYTGTGIAESTRRSFTVQSKDTFLKYSTIKTTGGSDYLTGIADKNGTARPRLPLDAARVILAPLTELKIAGAFDTRAAEGGQGGQFDLLGSNIIIAADDETQTPGALTISAKTLAGLDATSLLIGGQRADNADGTTAVNATARSITVRGGASLDAPELLLAVGGVGSTLTIEDGATLKATGDAGTLLTSDYAASTAGSILRLSSGGERLVNRTGTGASTIQVGAANIIGGSLGLDTSGTFAVADSANLAAKKVAISGGAILFDGSADLAGQAGVIGSSLEAKLAAADQLTVRSSGAIRFSAGEHRFNDLVLDTATLAASAGNAPTDSITLDAGNVRLVNSLAAADGCVVAGFCGQGGALTLNSATLSFGANDVRASGFSDAVTLAASGGMYVEGKGSFSSGATALTLNTPFLADRSVQADPRDQKVRPEYSFLTTAGFTVTAVGTDASAKPTGNGAPGTRINIGSKDAPVLSATIVGSLIQATAGIIDVESSGDIALSGATLSVPGYEKTFGDDVDPVTVSAGGGTINLLSKSGSLILDGASTLIVDTGTGAAGTLNLLAGNGAITLDAAINPNVSGNRQGSFAFDSGLSSFDFANFVTRYGTLFGGDVTVRSGAGDLGLEAGQSLKAKSVSLTADGGSIAIAGTIDTSGVNVAGMDADDARNADVNGGDIALWGRNGVTLASTAKLDTHTSGYADTDSRVASTGNVTIGIENQSAAITIASGAVIDVGARRTQAALAAGESGGRLVPQVITDPVTGNPTTVYRYAAPDTGGDVSFRAPVLGADEDKVNVSLKGSILGADNVQLEAFKRYDLDSIAESGLYSGITRDTDGTLLLNFADSSAGGGKYNPFTESFQLADGGSSVVKFIQGFDVSTVDGSSLDGVRLRPGVELASGGSIETTTEWNLAAASFSPEQLQAAVDAGVLQVIPELSTGGQTQFRVVPGQEGALLDKFATFLYRTDGGSARGEAPVVTLRAGGDLIVNRSISDGFFSFHDKSDPNYINWQLGGGNRAYSPAIQFTCGTATGSCANIPSYGNGANPGTNATLVIGLGSQAGQGDLTNGNPFVNSPLALNGNGAAGGGDGQDSLGFAELFPLLDGDVAMHSSDLRLIAGADGLLSANPLHVDRASDADMIVSGEYNYRVTASGSVTYNGPLQFRLVRSGTSPSVNFDVGDTLDLSDPLGGLDQLKDDAYTQLNWGSTAGLGADARAAALAYFAGKGYTFVGSASAPTGVIAPLNEVVAFLQTFEPTYQAGLASNRTGYTANRTVPLISYGNANQQTNPATANKAYVRSYIRTGDGSIEVAASRDIDIRGGTQTYRQENGTATATANYATNANASVDFSAAAIYTAGVRVAQAQISAELPSGDLVTIMPDSPYFNPTPEAVNFVPSPKALSDTAPVLAYSGGDISLDAGRDVLGSRDVWSERFLGSGASYMTSAGNGTSTSATSVVGQASQRWRVGSIDIDTEIAIAPRYFTAGVGALAGGDVDIRAGRDVTNLTVALTNSVTTAPVGDSAAMLSFGNGDLSLSAGRDILAGRFDVASGAAAIHAGANITSFGREPVTAVQPQYARIRLADAVVDVSAGGSIALASVSALGVDTSAQQSQNSAGFFSAAAAVSLSGNEDVQILPAPTGSLSAWDYGQQPTLLSGTTTNSFIQVLPPSFAMASLLGRTILPAGASQLLYPSPIGQLHLLSVGDIANLVIGMSDADPGLLGGAFVSRRLLVPTAYQLPAVLGNTTDAQLRAQHNRFATHVGDDEPVRIYSDGDIGSTAIFLPKQTRITAGGNITDMFFNGQNVGSDDVTRIRAGGDITGTIGSTGVLPYVRSNDFILGGPGTLVLEAGGDIGPFVTSANISFGGKSYSFAGGIRTVGNDYNPWLPEQGADLQVRFGVAAGADYASLRDTYLDPDNFAMLDGDLFVQVADTFGNQRPDRSKPIYAPILAAWLRDHFPDLFAEVFGGQTFANDAALADSAYGNMAELYTAFGKLDLLHQQNFLINDLYFNELGSIGDKSGPSFSQYIRGYRAVQTLFPTNLGYTDNLEPYTLDPATVTPDHPLGEPVRNIVDGQPQQAKRILTGNLDLRLATIQTARGGGVTILGPGGDLIAGSVVRTADQATRRATTFNPIFLSSPNPLGAFEAGSLFYSGTNFDSVPLGYEGLLTLRGGDIRSFTDGNFILNQSRAFTQQGGDIVMWSSNGDLNAGQGPKSASNFPPVTLRFDEDGFSEIDSAGSVAGAGIGTLQRFPDDPPSDVILIAPVGEVDAGDAGVRASGNVVVAAARVANADNFKAAGNITGVPSQAASNIAVTSNGANETQAQLKEATRAAQPPADRRSIISVDVLGPAGDGRCDDRNRSDDPDCSRSTTEQDERAGATIAPGSESTTGARRREDRNL